MMNWGCKFAISDFKIALLLLLNFGELLWHGVITAHFCLNCLPALLVVMRRLVRVSPAQRLAFGAPFGEAKSLQLLLGDPETSRNGFRLPRGLRLFL